MKNFGKFYVSFDKKSPNNNGNFYPQTVCVCVYYYNIIFYSFIIQIHEEQNNKIYEMVVDILGKGIRAFSYRLRAQILISIFIDKS